MRNLRKTQPMDPPPKPFAADLAPAARTAMAAPSRWARIIPVALVMYTIAFIDRTNISLALPRISRDLHLDPSKPAPVAGISSGVSCPADSWRPSGQALEPQKIHQRLARALVTVRRRLRSCAYLSRVARSPPAYSA